jgi:serine/threonine protein kinase
LFLEQYEECKDLFTQSPEKPIASLIKHLSTWEIPENEIEIDKTQEMGHGTYGTVYKVRLQQSILVLLSFLGLNMALQGKCRNNEVAVKEMKSSNQRVLEKFEREVAVMA